MPATVEEILKQSGLTEEQIKALDTKIMSGFSSVLTTAASAQDAAELAKRTMEDRISTEINPALDKWATEQANLEAQVAFYKKQNEMARAGGFVPQDAPGYTAPAADTTRDASGRYVAGGNPVPGSPQFVENVNRAVISGISTTTWAINQHLRLFGTPLPDDVETLVKESADNHMDFRAYVGKKYNFDGKQKELKEKAEKEHDDAIRKDQRALDQKEFTERSGSNPDLRGAEGSQFSTIAKSVKAGQLKDPLDLSPTERHNQTRSIIQKDVAERATA